MSIHYRGWALTKECREELLRRFHPVFSAVRADHVTHELCGPNTGPPEPASIIVTGQLECAGYQILAVMVNGEVLQPKRNRLYHVTVSHAPGLSSSRAGIILKQRQQDIQHFASAFPLRTTPFIRQLGSKPE